MKVADYYFICTMYYYTLTSALFVARTAFKRQPIPFNKFKYGDTLYKINRL